jgi:hypothetical protein
MSREHEPDQDDEAPQQEKLEDDELDISGGLYNPLQEPESPTII